MRSDVIQNQFLRVGYTKEQVEALRWTRCGEVKHKSGTVAAWEAVPCISTEYNVWFIKVDRKLPFRIGWYMLKVKIISTDIKEKTAMLIKNDESQFRKTILRYQGKQDYRFAYQ